MFYIIIYKLQMFKTINYVDLEPPSAGRPRATPRAAAATRACRPVCIYIYIYIYVCRNISTLSLIQRLLKAF